MFQGDLDLNSHTFVVTHTYGPRVIGSKSVDC